MYSKNKEEYVVSACMAGIPCRYDGTCKTNEYVLNLVNCGKAHAMCPEVLGGLNTPRDPAEIVEGRVITREGMDVTKEYESGALKVLDYCKKHNIKKAILMDKSPSCGLRIYDGTFSGNIINKKGITAQLLTDNDIEVISSSDIK